MLWCIQSYQPVHAVFVIQLAVVCPVLPARACSVRHTAGCGVSSPAARACSVRHAAGCGVSNPASLCMQCSSDSGLWCVQSCQPVHAGFVMQLTVVCPFLPACACSIRQSVSCGVSSSALCACSVRQAVSCHAVSCHAAGCTWLRAAALAVEVDDPSRR